MNHNVTNIENRLFDHYKYIDGHSKEYKAILDFNKLSKTKNYFPVIFNDYDIYQVDEFDLITKECVATGIFYAQTSENTKVKFLETTEDSARFFGFSPRFNLLSLPNYHSDYLGYLNKNIDKVMTTLTIREDRESKNSNFEYQNYGPWFALFSENINHHIRSDINFEVFKDLGYHSFKISVEVTASSTTDSANFKVRIRDQRNSLSPLNYTFASVAVGDCKTHTFEVTRENTGRLLSSSELTVEHSYKATSGIIRSCTIYKPRILTITFIK